MAILRGIKLTTALAAFALFFMPWLDIQCSGKSLATQTGIQTITGKASPSDEMQPRQDKVEEGDQLGTATLVAVALLCTGLGAACLLVALLNNKPALDVVGSALCGMALLCLLVQLSQDFPVKGELVEQISTDQASNDADMGSSLVMAMMANIEVETLPAFTITCALLGVPVVLLVSLLLAKLGGAKTE